MRSRIVEEVVRRGPAELAGKARALVPRGGNLAVQLLEVGYPPSAILDGCPAATGVQQAAPGWLREPSPPPVDYDDGLLFRAASSAPVAIDGDTLCVAYGNPEAAADSTSHGLPPHRPYLAMPAQLSRALALLPVEPTLAEALPTEPTRRAAWAQKSQDPPRSLADLEQRRIDRALDGADDDEEPEVEATRTVPGGAPPMAPSDPGAADPGDADAMTVATSLAEMRRVAQLSKPGPRSGPASQEGGGFEDVRTQQVDLVSPADRAAVEATVTRTEASAQAQPAAPEARKQQKLIVAEDDYEDVATVALSQGALRAMIAPQHFPHNVGHEPKSPDVEENPFDDPTEHVGVLASLGDRRRPHRAQKARSAAHRADPATHRRCHAVRRGGEGCLHAESLAQNEPLVALEVGRAVEAQCSGSVGTAAHHGRPLGAAPHRGRRGPGASA